MDGNAVLERDFVILLADVGRMLRTHVDQLARAEGMTRAQWAILARLECRPGMSQNELAQMIDVEPITVARLIDRLEGHGMVERRADPTDRRVRRLHLKPEADAVLKRIAAARTSIHTMLVNGIAPDALKTTTDSLLKMRETLAELRTERLAGE